MKISKEKPPNYGDILKVLPNIETENLNPIFTYGDTIYNVSGETIRKDLEIHEEVHQVQQGQYPDIWWFKYLTDIDFRLSQEIEAYAHQYNFIKKILPSRWHKEGLYEMAKSLSSKVYGSIINLQQAESRIRNHAKKL